MTLLSKIKKERARTLHIVSSNNGRMSAREADMAAGSGYHPARPEVTSATFSVLHIKRVYVPQLFMCIYTYQRLLKQDQLVWRQGILGI